MKRLTTLYRRLTGADPVRTECLPKAGSNRHYVRLFAADGSSVMGVLTSDLPEARCFVYLARHFRAQGIPAPAVLQVSDDCGCYIQEDLGTTSLYDALATGRQAGGVYGEAETALLRRTVRLLPHVQVEGAAGMDWERLTAPRRFCVRTAMFDLNYFKYMFLRTSDLPFDEERLEDDMQQMASDLAALSDGQPTFLYRDFQARNVMLREGEPVLIDFQGGQQGPVYYDVASFLMQASAHYPAALREELAGEYLAELSRLAPWAPQEQEFCSRLRLFMFFRTLQVLGAYGLRGRFERKPYFLNSIPAALQNLRALVEQGAASRYPYLAQLCLRLSAPE
ncbi:MAG: phosphotransferase [Bacteroidaceae bacterium]|nr:phosphotransferase [Candidatus Equimonas faecalis]MCQ2205759.1 phosphotransferase [Bacteroidaceae bacterium]